MSMKRYIIALLLFIIIFILTACAKSTPLTLSEVAVNVVTDEEISGSAEIGINESTFSYTPTMLHYTILLENISDEKVGSLADAISVSIQFETEQIPQTAKHYSSSYTPELEAGEKGRYEIKYDIGEILVDVPFYVPPDPGKIKTILDEALNAKLIIKIGEQELTRINLMEHKQSGS